MDKQIKDALLTVGEAAQRAHVDRATVDRAIKRGDLILAVICTTDEAGTHFMSRYDYDELQELEAEGLLQINRPVHDQTGIAYSQEYWSVQVTEDGIALVEANPEFCPEL